MHRACGVSGYFIAGSGSFHSHYPPFSRLAFGEKRAGFKRCGQRIGEGSGILLFFFIATNIMEEFSYGSEKWKRLRLKILRRDKYQCRICSRYGRIREATEVHHIIHSDERPDLAYDPSNLISLCHSCHEKQHPEKVQKSYKNRLRGNKYERA